MPHPLNPELDALVRQLAPAAGLEVRGVQVLTHRIPMTVQVLVQRQDGQDVTLDECAAFSGPLGDALEAAALLADTPYVLEVSSPGIADDLSSDRDFQSFRSFPVEVWLQREDGSTSCQQGLLLGRDAESVQLNVRGRTVRLPRQQVLRVHLTTPDSDG